jgi:hypothetical protein
MNPENYKTKRQGQPKRASALSKSKSSMLANAKTPTSYATPKLCEIYSAKTEWATKVIPKLKEQ